jgi:3-oxoacyl-[acyl-carrier protein] reductase
VALVARRAEETERQAAAIREEFGVESIALPADLSEEGACERVVAEAAARFGALEIVVPNAGGPRAAPFGELADEDWLAGFRLTLLSTVRLVRAAIPHLQKAGWGRIVTIGSLVTREPRPELMLSSTLRTGLVATHKLLARQHAKEGICVNMVSPGYTLTQRQIDLANAGREHGRGAMQAIRAQAAEIPAQRMAEPEEIGAVVAFLCSQPAAFVNGVNLVVDGAHTRGI